LRETVIDLNEPVYEGSDRATAKVRRTPTAADLVLESFPWPHGAVPRVCLSAYS
jgi:catalase (peroxidase I)